MSQQIPGQNAPVLGGAARSNRCFCGAPAMIGWVGDRRVRVCDTGDHVVLGYVDKVYVHVENPSDVIEPVARCWLCGGVDPNDTVKVAREYPDGPVCRAYTAQVHTGCWQDMDP